MSNAPSGAMKLLYVSSPDKEGKTQFTNKEIMDGGFTGMIARIGSGTQIHNPESWQYGHIRPTEFVDHSFNAHVQQAYDLGMALFAEFDLFLGSEFFFAGNDYLTEDNQFVPFKYLMSGKRPKISYHAIVLNIHMQDETAGNCAWKIKRFIEMIKDWLELNWSQSEANVPIYLRLTKKNWEKDNGEIGLLMEHANNMPYVLDGVTQYYYFTSFNDVPEPYEADVYEPGNFINYKYERGVLWHYGNFGEAQLFVAWGSPERIFDVIGSVPVNYESNSNGGNSNEGNDENNTGGSVVDEDFIQGMFDSIEELKGSLDVLQTMLSQSIDSQSIRLNDIYGVLLEVRDCQDKPWYKKLFGIK